MINIVDISDSPNVVEPSLHFTDICMNSGLSLIVAVIVEFMKGDTELSLKISNCPTLFLSFLVNPGLCKLSMNVRCIEDIDKCMKSIFQLSWSVCCRDIAQVNTTVSFGHTYLFFGVSKAVAVYKKAQNTACMIDIKLHTSIIIMK